MTGEEVRCRYLMAPLWPSNRNVSGSHAMSCFTLTSTVGRAGCTATQTSSGIGIMSGEGIRYTDSRQQNAMCEKVALERKISNEILVARIAMPQTWTKLELILVLIYGYLY